MLCHFYNFFRNKQLTDIAGRAIADNVVLLNELEEFDLYMYFIYF